MDLPELDQRRREVGNAKFEAQYQQAPSAAGGNIIRPEWFGTYQGVPRRSDYEAVLQSWDTAAVPGESNDYSVCTTWGLIGNHIDLLDVHREKYLYPDLVQSAIKFRQKWKPNLIVIEKAVTGMALKPDLVRKGVIEAHWLAPEGGKEDRAVAQSQKLAEKQVRLPVSAPWKEGFVAEAAGFPNSKYDDQVDSMSQALRALDFEPYALRHCSRYKGKK
jgi:predicted phage terminase large subunit-like protein